jgi:hypothetical protein
MEVIHPRCCGIDVHKESVVACLGLQEGRRVKIEVQRFGTTTAELLRLTEWLSQAACTHVARSALQISPDRFTPAFSATLTTNALNASSSQWFGARA